MAISRRDFFRRGSGEALGKLSEMLLGPLEELLGEAKGDKKARSADEAGKALAGQASGSLMDLVTRAGSRQTVADGASPSSPSRPQEQADVSDETTAGGGAAPRNTITSPEADKNELSQNKETNR